MCHDYLLKYMPSLPITLHFIIAIYFLKENFMIEHKILQYSFIQIIPSIII